jgi:hypothetical protein
VIPVTGFVFGLLLNFTWFLSFHPARPVDPRIQMEGPADGHRFVDPVGGTRSLETSAPGHRRSVSPESPCPLPGPVGEIPERIR